MKKYKEIIIELSQNCNLECVMCGFGKMENSPEKFMSYDEFRKLYDIFKDSTESIRINGRGESTIHPQFKQIVEYIGKEKEIILFTNGNYKNPDISKLFKSYNFQLYFSVDSIVDSKLVSIRRGVNPQVLHSNIKALERNTKRPFIIFTIQEINIDEIEAVADYAIENNCHLVYNVVRRDEGIEPFVKLIKNMKSQIITAFNSVRDKYNELDINCYIPDQMAGVIITNNKSSTCGSTKVCPNIDHELCILYNGDVTPCNMFNPYVYGNINEDTIENIMKGDKYRWFIANHKEYYYCENCACLKR